MNTPPPLIDHCWYVAMQAAALARGKMKPVTLLGQPLLFCRNNDGEVFALRDFCPHRGMPLRYGSFDGTEVECCYHGWKFGKDGRCTCIPSLHDDDKTDVARVRTPSYHCRESEGVIWVFMPAPGAQLPEPLPALPPLPGPQKLFRHVESVVFPCHVDHAVIGLMDPAHGPFVHKSWWWRTRKSIHAKQKHFAPQGLGFKMVAHKPSSNSRAYKILGGQPVTEIAFQLPGLRTEHIIIGKRHIVLLTALTPIDETQTALHQFIATDIPLIHALLPLLKLFGRAFIRQDLVTVARQQEGLIAGHPSLMLLGDADQQALWYFRLKKEYLEAQAQGTAFENPLREKTLRWKS